MDYKVSFLKPEDASDYLEYLKIIGSQSDNLSFGKEGLEITEDEEKIFIKNITSFKKNAMFCVKDEKKIIANCNLLSLKGRFSHRCELSISVLKDYWNKKIGQNLLSLAIDYAKNVSCAKVISLEVRSDNYAAIHLYKKMGFREIGKFEKFFKVDNKFFDAYIMTLYL